MQNKEVLGILPCWGNSEETDGKAGGSASRSVPKCCPERLNIKHQLKEVERAAPDLEPPPPAGPGSPAAATSAPVVGGIPRNKQTGKSSGGQKGA